MSAGLREASRSNRRVVALFTDVVAGRVPVVAAAIHVAALRRTLQANASVASASFGDAVSLRDAGAVAGGDIADYFPGWQPGASLQ